MSDRLTQKQEQFCIKYLELGNASEAYRQVYGTAKTRPETSNRNGFKLLQNSKIVARIDSLRAESAEIAVLTQAGVINDLMGIKNRAIASGADVTAIKALELLGKNLGMWQPDTMVAVQVNNNGRESFEDILSKALYIENGMPNWEEEKARQIGAAYLAYQRGETLPDPLVIGGLVSPFEINGYVIEHDGPIPEGLTVSGPDHDYIVSPKKCESMEEWTRLANPPKE
ncbi:MAG: terminase small subunit [Leptospirales bacterium]